MNVRLHSCVHIQRGNKLATQYFPCYSVHACVRLFLTDVSQMDVGPIFRQNLLTWIIIV